MRDDPQARGAFPGHVGLRPAGWLRDATGAATSPRDGLVIAERAVAVAEAKWKQDLQGAFTDGQAKRDLATAQAEYELKRAERDYARDLVEKTVVRAPRPGIVIFNEANDLAGRPVSTGQRIMEIADRARVLVRINVPVEDSIVLRAGARTKVFLDSDPLHAVEARATSDVSDLLHPGKRSADNALRVAERLRINVRCFSVAHASHGARLIEGNQFVYRADASGTGRSYP